MKINYNQSGILNKILNAFYPERCPYCNCVVRQGEKGCDKCTARFPDFNYKQFAVGGFETVSPLPYDDIFADAIKKFKFNDATQLAYQLAIPMAQTVAKEYKDDMFDLICCVPLHPDRLDERGYNQSELLSKQLSKLLDIPYEQPLIKTRNTLPQHSLDRSKRGSNIKGAFRIKQGYNVENKTILLVDDIITTGHTLGECANTLQSKGCTQIKCVTFASSITKRVEIPITL